MKSSICLRLLIILLLASGYSSHACQLEIPDTYRMYAASPFFVSNTNLNWGSYTFKIKFSGNRWPSTGATLQIVMQSPVWHTWWAYGVYALLGMGIVLFLMREIVRRERLKTNLKIQQLESEKLHELNRLKLHLFAHISDEFRTPLTLISATVEKLRNRHPHAADKADYDLIICNSNRLLQLISKLPDLSGPETGKLNIPPRPGELNGYLKVLGSEPISYTPIYTDFVSEELHNGTGSGMEDEQYLLKQILLVEDNIELQELISGYLSGMYHVSVAGNGLTGYQQALETIPDLIITDGRMPEMEGTTFCHKLKTNERTSHIPVILLTAKPGTESRLPEPETEADDYLIKPFHLQELDARIKKLIEECTRRQEKYNHQLLLNPQEIKATSTDKRFLQKAMAVVETNIANAEFDVECFSKEIGMSRAHLHRKLTALTAQSPSEFIRNFRLKRAASLLLQHCGNVSEVAYRVGFSSLNYFTKCFKEHYGKTPTEYQKNNLHHIPES